MREVIPPKFLPIGTVVMLKNGSKRLMINGFCSIDSKNPGKTFDYVGVLFPEGSLGSDQALLFDHNQIERIDYMGLNDKEEKEFNETLNRVVKEANLN